MAWYSVGTIAVTTNSTTVTGTGTSFDANARVGDAFQGPDGAWYEVTNIASASVLSIKPAYRGASASSAAYSVAPMQGYVKASADALRGVANSYGAALASLGPIASWQPGLPLVLSGVGSRVQADLSNSTLSNRLLFQSSTTNANSALGIVPNGTATSAGLTIHNNSNPDASSYLNAFVDASSIILRSQRSTGSQPVLPFVFQADATPLLQISTAGDLNLPLRYLQFLGSAQRIVGDMSNGSYSNRLMFQTNTGNGDSYMGVMPNGTSKTSGLTAYNATSGAASYLAMYALASETRIASGVEGAGTYLPLTFYNNGAERMRIGTNGQVLIGAASSEAGATPTLHVNGMIASTNGYRCRPGNGGTPGGNVFNINWTNSPQLWVDYTNIGTIAFTTSDERVKEDIQALDIDFLERVRKYQVVTFKYKEGTLLGQNREPQQGFIAQAVQKVNPQAVIGKDGALTESGGVDPMGIQDRAVISDLTGAMQQLDSQLAQSRDVIAEQAQTIVTQAEQITAILARLEKLEAENTGSSSASST
ncbi:MAG: hypothetical protein GAK36_00215 [Pseudomonas sp.]|nr:MAG: hypothetical protein GAK36_00215 [Pseudomonas sp.]